MLVLTLTLSLAHAAPTLIGCISTPDDTAATDSWTVNFVRDGRLILVSTTPQETASGWLELRVAGSLYVPLLTGSHASVYHAEATGGRSSSELMTNAHGSWGTRLVTLHYSTEFGSTTGEGTVTGCVYYEPGPTVRTGDVIASFCADPMDDDSTSFTVDVPYSGYLVSSRTSCGSGGGALDWYVNGEGVVQQEADCATRPYVLAFPVLAAQEVTIDIVHEDDTWSDNTGTRCVDVSFSQQ